MDGGQGQGRRLWVTGAWNEMCFDQYGFSYYISTVAYCDF